MAGNNIEIKMLHFIDIGKVLYTFICRKTNAEYKFEVANSNQSRCLFYPSKNLNTMSSNLLRLLVFINLNHCLCLLSDLQTVTHEANYEKGEHYIR